MIDIAVAFICACLAGMGVGGGGLLVIYLTLIKKTDQVTAQGINLVFFVVCMTVALIMHIKNKRIYKNILPIAIPFCILGGMTGSFLALFLPSEILRFILGGFLIISGILSLVQKSAGRVLSEKPF